MRKRLFITCSLIFFFVSATGAFGEGKAQSQTKPAAVKAAAVTGLTIDDVIKMSKAGLGDDIIIQEIRKKSQAFDLTPDQLIQLKTASVSNRVIEVMVNPSKADMPVKSAAAANAQAAVDPSLPTEIGVYAKRKGQWTEILPEVVNWKTGGILKSIASAGIVKGDVNGHLEGANSRNSLTTPLEFVIVAPEGVAITEYQLLHLRQNEDNREFRTMTGGVMHVSGGATRDLVPFEGKKVAPRVFSVILPANLGAGEYGFLPPGSFQSANMASGGKLYTFRVIE